MDLKKPLLLSRCPCKRLPSPPPPLTLTVDVAIVANSLHSAPKLIVDLEQSPIGRSVRIRSSDGGGVEAALRIDQTHPIGQRLAFVSDLVHLLSYLTARKFASEGAQGQKGEYE